MTIKPVPLLRVSTEEDLASPIDRRSDYYRRQASLLQKTKTGKAASTEQLPELLLTLPNILTLLRLFLVPVLLVVWFIPYEFSAFVGAIVFIIASLTDYADGVLARKLELTSAFGSFLDPVADKVMVSTALILLAVTPPHPITHFQMIVPVTVMIAREITMSALREWAAVCGPSVHSSVKVGTLGKWKTAIQMIAMSGLLLLRDSDVLLGNKQQGMLHCCWFSLCGVLFLNTSWLPLHTYAPCCSSAKRITEGCIK